MRWLWSAGDQCGGEPATVGGAKNGGFERPDWLSVYLSLEQSVRPSAFFFSWQGDCVGCKASLSALGRIHDPRIRGDRPVRSAPRTPGAGRWTLDLPPQPRRPWPVSAPLAPRCPSLAAATPVGACLHTFYMSVPRPPHPRASGRAASAPAVSPPPSAQDRHASAIRRRPANRTQQLPAPRTADGSPVPAVGCSLARPIEPCARLPPGRRGKGGEADATGVWPWHTPDRRTVSPAHASFLHIRIAPGMHFRTFFFLRLPVRASAAIARLPAWASYLGCRGYMSVRRPSVVRPPSVPPPQLAVAGTALVSQRAAQKPSRPQRRPRAWLFVERKVS